KVPGHSGGDAARGRRQSTADANGHDTVTPRIVHEQLETVPRPIFRHELQSVVVAIGTGIQLSGAAESRVGGLSVWKRTEAALAYGLETIRLREIWLVYRARTGILGPQIDRIANLTFQCEAPLHEIG